MRDNYNETNISFCKLQILSNDENLVQAGHEALMETLHLHHFIETTCKGLQTTLSSEKHLFDMLFSKEIKFDSLSHEMKSFYQNQANDNTAEKKKLS